MEKLETVVREAMLPAFRDKLTEEDVRWNSLGKLIVRLG